MRVSRMRRAGAAAASILGAMCLAAPTCWATDSLTLTLARGSGPGEVSLEWDGGGPFAVSRAEAAELIGDPGAHLANTGASAWLDSGVSPILFYRVVETTCGNGQIDFGEECDDGAHANGDGCSARCTREAAGQWQRRIQDWIAERTRSNHGLTGCIGCGRLSLDRCRYASPADRAGRRGPGRRYWTGDRPANDPTRKQRRRV